MKQGNCLQSINMEKRITTLEEWKLLKESKEEMFGGKPFEYPKDHKLGMKVPETGSHCANCKFLSETHKTCENPEWVKWHNNDNKLPYRDEEYCCDLWQFGEKKKKVNESEEAYHQNGGTVPQESEWTEVEDPQFAGKKHWAIKFNGEYYIINDPEFFKNNIGKSVSFKYKTGAKYPVTIMPKVLAGK